MIDPVLHDLNRYMAQQDADDRLEAKAEEIRLAYTPDEAKEIINDYLFDTGGDDVTALLAELATTGAPLQKLFGKIDAILKAAAEKTVRDRDE